MNLIILLRFYRLKTWDLKYLHRWALETGNQSILNYMKNLIN